jgi:hypothetical protein
MSVIHCFASGLSELGGSGGGVAAGSSEFSINEGSLRTAPKSRSGNTPKQQKNEWKAVK